jgi:uncharacterized circularly permuted ATP-grasp superfamily protein/uncharacterized alpha-E superfamily protein
VRKENGQIQEQRQGSGTQSFATRLRTADGAGDGAGHLPPDEQQLLRTLEQLGIKRLLKRHKEAQRLLRENGATYNDFDTRETARAWQFDPIPLLIDAKQWAGIEAGLIQRAELFNLILADIYGPQKLIEAGLLPPELIYAHKGFLWPCVGMPTSGGRHLNLYSANLARGRDGRYWVLEDHSQPPFGSGYALENRIVMGRSFPRLFQDFQVHRLALFFRALGQRLTSLARHNQAEPCVVVLTPGPETPHYFEHAYLAAYLGFPLVLGADLIVRDGCVWLKTVGGLRQVDVIFNRMEDEYCDPLELRDDSRLGVTGLLEAIRLGNVVTSNFVGCSLLRNPALLAFLPALCRYLLKEELKLPSVATWWCGQPREREFVLRNLNRLVIRPIHPLSGLPEKLPGELSRAQLEQWRLRITADPHLYVGQELSSLAGAPSFISSSIEPRPCVLSTYLTSNEHSYQVLSGGLARVDADEVSLLVAKSGGYSKDTWVLTGELDKQVNLWRDVPPNHYVEPTKGSLPSRAAENLFWAGRYAERSEATARLLRSILNQFREFSEFRDPDDRRSLEHLLRALTHVTQTYPGFVGEGAVKRLADPRDELMSLASDVERPGSLRSSLRGFASSAYFVRDTLPVDAWRIVDNIQQNWNPRFSISLIGSGRLHDSIDSLLVQLSAFSGLNNDNMARETDWLFLKIGRSLERGLNLLALLRATLVPYSKPSMEAQMFATVLATSSSLITYRRRYRSFMQLPMILELLLTDVNYPRSFAYQLHQLQRMVAELPQRLADQAEVKGGVINEFFADLSGTDLKLQTQVSGNDANYPLLEELLKEQKVRLEKLSETLMQLYFSPTLVRQQLGPLRQRGAA